MAWIPGGKKPVSPIRISSASKRKARHYRPRSESLEARALMTSFQGLGAANTYADAISADGSTVVGNSLTVGAFYWKSSSTGIVPLFQNFSGSATSPTASGVSGDGSVIVGTLPASISSQRQAFRWTSGSGAATLPALASAIYSTGNAISEDGSVIAGDTDFSGYESGYTDGSSGLTIIPPQTTSGITLAQGTTVSANGSVVAGTYSGTLGTTGSGGAPYLFANNKFTPISDGTATSGTATAVSADGSFVVGERNFTGTTLAFDWTQQSGPVNLIMPAGMKDSTATGVSSGGANIVGYMSASPSVFNNENGVAFIWNQADGEQNLQQVLTTQYGLGSALTGWTLNEATAITPNGTTIVGIGTDPMGQEESWVANLSQEGTKPPTNPGTALPTIFLTANPTTSTFGQTVAFSADVSAATTGMPTPTGEVSFVDNSPSGSINLGTYALASSGIATVSTASLPVGINSITATYLGDSNYGSNSALTSETVASAATSGLAMVSASLTPDGMSVNTTYTISGADLSSAATIDYYWATGPNFADYIPTESKPIKIPAQVDIGSCTITVPISLLGHQPIDATYILAVADSPEAVPGHNIVSVLTGLPLEASGTLTAYRPITPGINFQDYPIPASEKNSEGVGIRIDGSASDNSLSDNNLIELDATLTNINPIGYDYIVESNSNNINIYNNMSKSSLLLSGSGQTNYLPTSQQESLWVEWDGTSPGTATINLQAKNDETGVLTTIDTVNFHTFNSDIIMFTGESGAYNTTVEGPILNIDKQLYIDGYDVHIYTPSTDPVRSLGASPPYAEAENAVSHRGVREIALIGYSHGGGAIYDLARKMNNTNLLKNNNVELIFSAYIDAIENASSYDPFPVIAIPPGSEYTFNAYETNQRLVHGKKIKAANVNEKASKDNHFTIATDLSVINNMEASFFNNVKK